MLSKLRNYWKEKTAFKQLKKDNKGSSFVLVMVSVALIMILVAVLFVMMFMQYRMVNLNRQTKDNFYYLEEVLGEMRAGIGNESVQQLKKAYDETVAMVVYYDTNQNKYMSVSSETATDIMRNKFHQYIAGTFCTESTGTLRDASISRNQLQSILLSYVKDVTIANNTNTTASGVTITFGNNFKCKAIQSTNPVATIGYKVQDITVSRVDKNGNEQSITTDITIYPPKSALNFLASADDLENLFTYALAADYGIEVTGGSTTNVRIVGNVYAAADFRDNGIYGGTITDPTASTLGTITGSRAGGAQTDDNSNYSGIFVSGQGTSLSMSSDVIAVNGSIAAKDGAKIVGNTRTTGTNTGNSRGLAKSIVWANNIATLGARENSINLNGEFNIADDLELNAEESNVKLTGAYYGYNYAAEDEFEPTAGHNQITSAKDPKQHTNSSAIIVNGEKCSLDLSGIESMIVNGRAYLDVASKKANSTDTVTNDIKTAETIAVKGTQLVYRVLDITNLTPTFPALSTDGYDKAGTQDLGAKYPSANVIRFLVHQFFEEGGNAIYTNNDSENEAYQSYWLNIKKEDVLADIAASGKDSKYYKDIMQVYFPTNKVLEASEHNGKQVYKYKTRDAGDMITITSCYDKQYKIWDNASTLKTNAGKIQQYGFITIGEDYDEVAVVKMVTGTAESPENYYFYQFYDDTAKQKFVEDYVAYSSSSDAAGIEDIDSTEVFDSTKIEMPSEDSSVIYTRGLYTILDDVENKYVLKDSLESTTYTEAQLKEEYNTRLSLAKVYKCYFPKANAAINTEQTTNAAKMYENGTRDDILNGAKFAYTTKSENISPLTNAASINIDWSQVRNKQLAASEAGKGKQLTGYTDARVWLSADDLVIKESDLTDGKANGIILCMGNVTLENVKEFRGSIICAGKLKIVGDTKIYADEQLCNNMLNSDTANEIRPCFALDELDPAANNTADTVAVTSITYTDLVGFENWIKNGE